MLKYLLITFVLILNLHSQTEPEIIFEKKFNIEDDYSSIIGSRLNIIHYKENYYLLYDYKNHVEHNSSGVLKLSEAFDIISRIEYWNYDCHIQNIFIHDEKEYIMNRVSKEDPEHPNYYDFVFPKLNIINEDTVENDLLGDIEKQKYRSYIVDIKDEFIHIFAEKITINGSDTLKQRFIDKYDFSFNLIESNEIDTNGHAIEKPLFPDSFIVLDDGSYIVSERGPFIDFNLIYKHSALTKFDSKGKIIWSKLIFKEQIAWYYELYKLANGSFLATGYHKSSTNAYLTLTRYNENFNISWEKNITPQFGSLYQFFSELVPLNDGEFYVSYGKLTINPLTFETRNAMKLYNSKGEEIQFYVWGEAENNFVIEKVLYNNSDNSLIILSSNGNKDFTIYKIGNFTSVNENIEKDRISISPNPVKEYIKLDISSLLRGAGGVFEIEIYNVLGEKVITLSPALSQSERELRIDVSHLTPGVYFIKIGDKVEKFVKE